MSSTYGENLKLSIFGQSHGGALDGAAHTVAVFPGGGDDLLHALGFVFAEYREIGADLVELGCEPVKKGVIQTVEPFDVRADPNPFVFQPLLAQPARDAQGSRQPSGEMTAACRILEAAVFDLGGVVRMTGPGAVLEIAVIPGAGVFVVDDGGNGSAAGIPDQDSS